MGSTTLHSSKSSVNSSSSGFALQGQQKWLTEAQQQERAAQPCMTAAAAAAARSGVALQGQQKWLTKLSSRNGQHNPAQQQRSSSSSSLVQRAAAAATAAAAAQCDSFSL
jgi:hypothetical protein